jgi:methylamine dehydrogenase accessory protein MauD
MTATTILMSVLWVAIVALSIAVYALSRQVGILFERVSPLGALITDAGPGVGAEAPVFLLPTLEGTDIALGGQRQRATLLFFLSPTCPVCKKLLPILKSIDQAEASWLDVVLASDGPAAEHRSFVQQAKLQRFPYVLSSALGMSYRVSRLPFAVLIGEHGRIDAKGLVNNREQLESLFHAKELGVGSIQHYLDQTSPS